MRIGKKIYGVLVSLIILVLAFVSIGFVNKDNVGYRVDDIAVNIENRSENFFVDEADVMALIMENEGDSILGDHFGAVNLKEIEERIESHSFVKEAEVFRDLKGHLVVAATQSKPVARIVAKNGKHAYISEEGLLLPVSSNYTARVIVLTGDYMSQLSKVESVLEDEYHAQLFELIKFVNQDSFWNMQIAEINVDRKGKIVMMPQVGNQRLEFGKAEDIEDKFKRLKIFFKEIMPTKGWNAYERVNVEFKDQIICDK